MFKNFTKSENDTWDDIARRAYGTPEKAGDIEKLNNGVKTGDVLVLNDSDSQEVQEESGGVYFRHGEQDFKEFSQYSLYDSMESIRGAIFICNKTDIDYNFSFIVMI